MSETNEHDGGTEIKGPQAELFTEDTRRAHASTAALKLARRRDRRTPFTGLNGGPHRPRVDSPPEIPPLSGNQTRKNPSHRDSAERIAVECRAAIRGGTEVANGYM